MKDCLQLTKGLGEFKFTSFKCSRGVGALLPQT